MYKYQQLKSKIFQMYLRGLRGHFDNRFNIPKNTRTQRYLGCILISLYSYGWIQHNLTQHEFDIRKQPNFMIPKFIYKSRREHYIYWESSRLARGLASTFTYYDWDPQSEMICYTNLRGEQRFEKNIFHRERLEIMDNALFEEIIRADVLTPKLKKRGALLVAYELNKDNRYDLDNYLHYKPINPMDVLRSIYYQFYVTLGFTNKYRYDHFLSKPDWIYEFEKMKIAVNGMDRLNYFNNIKELLQSI